jgi:chromosomal replication initiation ATPase DnaA
MPDQLVFSFGVTHALGRDDFIVASSNEQALAFIERWPDWPTRSAAIWGPAQAGKTHLASIWCARSDAHLVPASHLSAMEFAELPAGASLALELADMARPDTARDRALLALFERPAGNLLLTARSHPSEWAVTIADLKSRYDSLLAFPLWAPDDALLTGLIRKHFSDRQLEVADAVVARLLTHLERTPEAIAAFVARSDEKALAEKRAVSERLVLELIDAESSKRFDG